MTKETLEKILEKNKRIYNKRNHIDGIRCVTIEEEDSEMFEDLVNICINSGYKIISSSCNSSNWKAILVEDEYDATKQVDVMPKHIIFHKVTWEFHQLIGFDPDLEEYIIRPYKMKRAGYQNVTQEELNDDYTNDKNEIMQLMEEREKIISDRLSFAEYIYDKIPERTIWTYYHVVRQLDHIQNMDFYKDEKNKQTLAQVRHPLRKAIRRKQKYMHRFISNEDIERFRNLIIAEEHKNCKDYINYKKSYEYLFYFGFTKIRDKCKDTLKIIARMKKELEEINDLKEDRKGS